MNVNESMLNQKYREYRQELIKRFWDFQQIHFQKEEGMFERAFDPINPNRPPVFKRTVGKNNLLVYETWSDETKNGVYSMIPSEKWHRWFPSMTSSQALTQSVFGNLKVLNELDCLAELEGDDGKPLFIRGTDSLRQVRMEHEITYLGEKARKTNVDVFFGGNFQVAMECKLSEREVGPCSRPRLSRSDEQYCDGSHSVQGKRTERCALTQIGVKYWKYIPNFFSWDPNKDYYPCPLNDTYQLVRNVLAACLRSPANQEDAKYAEPADGHAVLIYDERNPEFLEGGKGWVAWSKVKEALKEDKKAFLQKCSWQQIISAIKKEPELSWLVEMLSKKYGFCLENT